MSPGNPFPVSVDLKVSRENSTTTIDSNVFPPETNKILTKGALSDKFWVKCDGKGNMNFHHLTDPIKTIKELGKLHNEGLITDEQFEQAKRILLDRI